MTSTIDPTLFAAAIVTVIAALTGGVVQIFNAMSAANDRRAARLEREQLTKTTQSTEKKADSLIEKTAEIHTLTNSNLSKMTAAVETANEKIAGLERLIASMLLNQQSAKSTRIANDLEIAKALATPVETRIETTKLEKKLDENTVATDKNTTITKQIQAEDKKK